MMCTVYSVNIEAALSLFQCISSIDILLQCYKILFISVFLSSFLGKPSWIYFREAFLVTEEGNISQKSISHKYGRAVFFLEE